jgi:hypothetical protein
MTAAAVIVLAAVSVAVALSVRPPAKSTRLTPLERHEVANRIAAASWVSHQVSRDALIACDRQMCAALVQQGYPAAELHVLGKAASYPLTSNLVVETQAVRSLFGTSLASSFAPTVLTTFGTGTAEISIRVMTTNAAGYNRALAADLQSRQKNAAELLGGNQITASAQAKAEMLAGDVDSRLLVAIAGLAVNHPVDIVGFGNIATGASPDVPLRYADLALSVPAAHLSPQTYYHAIVVALGKLQAPYKPAAYATVKIPGGQSVLRIQVAAPSPLGLLGPAPSNPPG